MPNLGMYQMYFEQAQTPRKKGDGREGKGKKDKRGREKKKITSLSCKENLENIFIWFVP